MCAPDPPPPPDYAGAATAQGVANKDAAVAGASLSNPNIYGPLGSQTVTYGNTGPDGNAQPTITQTLTPAAQQTLDAQQRVQLGLSGLGEQALGTAGNIIGSQFDPQNVGITTRLGNQGQAAPAPDLSAYGSARSGINAPGVDYGPAAGLYGTAKGNVQGPNLQNQLDTSNVAALPVNAGTTAQNAIMSRLQPQVEQNRSSLAQQLANQGIGEGSEAFNRAQTQRQQGENDLYTQAALQGINLDMAANQQGMSNAVTSGTFGNNAQLANFAAGLQNAGLYNSAVGQNFAQGQAASQAYNQAQNQAFGQEAQNLGLYNQALAQNQNTALQQQQANNASQAQNFNQALQGATFGNQAAAQNLQQQLALYNQPLNQIAALMSGSQIQMPQFQGYTGQNVQAAPVYQATADAGNFAQQNYQNQVAASNGVMGGIGGLFGGLTSMFEPIKLFGK